MINSIIILSLLSLLLTFLFLKIFILIANKRFISEPNDRSSHKIPTLQGAGISFVLIGSFFSYIIGNFSLVITAIPIALVGLIDDLYKLNSISRYVVHISTVFYLVNIYDLPKLIIFNQEIYGIFFELLFVVFLTGVINFINFMDGIDGLVALNLSIFIFVAAIEISPSFYPLLGSLIGFLIFNWSPAKLFMGDTGSTFLGGILVATILQKNSFIEIILFLLILSPILFDAFFCIIRRFMEKENIFKPHSLHLYQRLYQAGWTHDKITIIYGLGTFILALFYLNKNYVAFLSTIILEIFCGIYLDKKVALPFKKSLQNK